MTAAALRLATESDLPVINEIYNHYVITSTCTYQTEPETIESRAAWFADHAPDKYPVTVVEVDGEVVGWGSLSKFRLRAAYAPTVEASAYIRHDKRRQGLGRLILTDLIERARAAGYHSLIGGVSADQTGTLALNEKLGFKKVAHLVEVGYKFGQRLDVVYFQLMLDSR